MLQNIPTHVIAGPLGAGKTSLIRSLLAQRPSSERWAVLVNEFGLIGLDAALLAQDDDGITIGEVAGGCLCCVNGMPFQVGLSRLLRKARPDRLFIEPSGLGHPRQLLQQLQQAPWQGVLQLRPLLMVLDAEALASGAPLPAAQQEALAMAGMLVFNKAGAVDGAQRLLISSRMPTCPHVWTNHGILQLVDFKGFSTSANISTGSILDNLPADNPQVSLTPLWVNPNVPICQAQQGDAAWSVGWRWHPALRFDQAGLQAFLSSWHWRRAKGVIHSAQGWQSFNALEGSDAAWASSEWRKDSRLELIFDDAQSLPALNAALAACRLEQ